MSLSDVVADLTPQPWSSPQNGVSVPQRVYERTPGRGPPSHFGQGLVLFLLTDGSCLPASLALDKKYKFTELIHRDDLALPDAAQTVTVRVEVSKATALRSTLVFIGRVVDGIPTPRLPGELGDTLQPGETEVKDETVKDNRLG